MAILNILGFENGTNDDFAAAVGNQSATSATVRTGGFAYRCNTTTTGLGAGAIQGYNAQGASAAISQNQHTIRTYFNYSIKAASGDEEILHFARNDDTTKASVRLNSSGNLVVYDGTPAVVATGSTVLSQDTWYRIEFQVVYGTSGTYELRINGATELSGSIDTNVSVATNPQRVYLGKSVNRNSNAVTYFFDDIVLRDDTTWPGAGEVKAMLPTANGSTMQWTAGTGSSDFEEVNNVPRSATSYVQTTSNAGDVALFAMQDTSTVGISGTINGINVMIAVWEAPSATSANQIRLVSGATTSDSTARNLGTATTGQSQRIYAIDPNTSAAWTLSALDAIEAGSIEGNAVVVRMSMVFVQVDYTPASTTTSTSSTSSSISTSSTSSSISTSISISTSSTSSSTSISTSSTSSSISTSSTSGSTSISTSSTSSSISTSSTSSSVSTSTSSTSSSISTSSTSTSQSTSTSSTSSSISTSTTQSATTSTSSTSSSISVSTSSTSSSISTSSTSSSTSVSTSSTSSSTSISTSSTSQSTSTSVSTSSTSASTSISTSSTSSSRSTSTSSTSSSVSTSSTSQSTSLSTSSTSSSTSTSVSTTTSTSSTSTSTSESTTTSTSTSSTSRSTSTSSTSTSISTSTTLIDVNVIPRATIPPFPMRFDILRRKTAIKNMGRRGW